MQYIYRYCKKFTFWLLVIFLLPFYQSCTEDIDVFAGGPSVPIVYCLLNPFDTIHYVRISKSYITEKGTNGLTSEPDSLVYPGDIQVSLERWDEDRVEEIIVFEKFTGPDKDPGDFPGEKNILYRAVRRIYPESKYVLYVYLEDRGLVLDAEAKMVGKLKVIDPFPIPQRKISLTSNMDFTIRWNLASEAWIYQTVVKFNYDEINGQDTISKSFDWVQKTVHPDFLESNVLSIRLNGAVFYTEMLKNIEEIPEIKRKAVDMSFSFYYGGLELRFYVESISPASSVLQEKPSYTNFNNCEGVFSSLGQKEINNILLSNIFIDSIANSRQTAHLGFVNSRDSLYIK